MDAKHGVDSRRTAFSVQSPPMRRRWSAGLSVKEQDFVGNETGLGPDVRNEERQ